MESVLNYLQHVKNTLANFQKVVNVHLVLGNESCDMDSSVATLLTAYHLHRRRPAYISKNTIVIPVLNVSKEAFLYRADVCHLFQAVEIPLDMLVYKDQIDFEELLALKHVTTSLVDHHVLADKDKMLGFTVVQIIDHRPFDESCGWDPSRMDLKMVKAGSCCTLVADTIFSSFDNDLCPQLAYLLYAAIVCDCKAFDPTKDRATGLDVVIAQLLESKYNFSKTRDSVYQKLQQLRSDVSHLQPHQILKKDTKIVESIPVVTLPMIVHDFLQLEDVCETLEQFAIESKALCIVLKGSDNGKTEVGVFYTEDGEQLKEKILNKLLNSKEDKGYDFEFTDLKTEFKNMVLLSQGNRKLSRKQMIPLIKEAVIEHNSPST